jgi:para-aminobenzoate synthetase component I
VNRTTTIPLPYRPDSCDYFARLRRLPGAVFLDSARPYCTQGRFDLMAALPDALLLTRDGETDISDDTGCRRSREAPFDLLAAALQRELPAAALHDGEWPFAGGIIGCFGYELGRRLHRLAPRQSGSGFPELFAGIYSWALMQDHDRRRAALVFNPACASSTREQVLRLVDDPSAGDDGAPFVLESAFHSNLEHPAYARVFRRIRQYIDAGDCYQVNVAQRLQARASGDPWQAYLQLRKRMASPYSAFVRTPTATLLSFSPERFLHLADGRVETRPIKGTIRQSPDADTDRQQAARLLASEKDRAENIMIVDLMRNDLGKSCRIGSVHVEKLCALESYANVHHLVSVVSGRLRADQSALQLLANCFPGGSITGAPKHRAMQIIDEVEPHPRDIYCGSLGYVSTHGVMDTSIAIRGLVVDAGSVFAWGGGGIVADSDCDTEYRESLIKIEPLLNGLLAGSASPLTDSGYLRA